MVFKGVLHGKWYGFVKYAYLRTFSVVGSHLDRCIFRLQDWCLLVSDTGQHWRMDLWHKISLKIYTNNDKC